MGGLVGVGPFVKLVIGGGGGNGGGGGALLGDSCLGGDILGTGGGGGNSVIGGSGVAVWEWGLLERGLLSRRDRRWAGTPFGGDMTASGGGGGGGSVSRPVDILRPRVGVLLADGVELLLGGAGGGWDGRIFKEFKCFY